MKISKIMGRLLGDDKTMDNILLQSRNMDEVYTRLGYILSYHISTRSKKAPQINGVTPEYLLGEPEWQALSQDKLRENIIENGFVTHSFNGYNLKSVKKYGLGDKRIYDKELAEDLDFVCSKLGDGEYTQNQGGGSNEVYYTAPGAKTFHYVCAFSPERLWLGPLKQKRDSALPIIIGETKAEYALRVLEKKVFDLGDTVSIIDKKLLLEKGAKIIEKMCSKKPVIALIRIKSKKHKLTAYHSTTKEQKENSPKLLDLLFNGTGSYSPDNLQTFFTENTNFIEFNNLGNLVHTGRILPSELELFEAPDSFLLMQRKAVLEGMKNGDKIDYFTGRKYEERQQSVTANQRSVENRIKPAKTEELSK